MADKAAIIHDMKMALIAALAAVEPEAFVEAKPMFGEDAYGKMFAAWFGAGLALKLPEAARAELLKMPGAKQSQSAQYVEVPPEFLTDLRLLEPWAAQSVAYSQSAKPRGKRKSKN